MDRVNIPGEAPGSATYYMGFAPEEYGTINGYWKSADATVPDYFLIKGI